MAVSQARWVVLLWIHAVATELAANVDRSIRPASQGLWLRGAAE